MLVACGLFVGVYASRNYPLGTLRHIGPGMFPTMLGYVLAALGAIVFLAALLRAGPAIATPAYRPLLAVLVGLLAFALTIEPFGLVPAIFLLIGISSLAESRLRPLGIVIFAATMSLFVVVVFQIGLQLPIESFKWPL